MSASATIDTGERAVFVPITPCRVMDTRPAPETVGARATPLGAGETHSISVLGLNGNCTIPADAVGLSMNVTAIFPTASSFLTVFPFGAVRPLASNLNWVAGQPPVPNAVTADIGAGGMISFFNLTGTVNVAADIVGYYVDHTHNDIYYTKTQVDTALALKANLPVTGAQILDRTITGIDIALNSITTFEIATDAIDSDEVLDFSLSNQDIGVLFAQVNADGTLGESNGGGGVTSQKVAGFPLGTYEVDFNVDISDCGAVATQGDDGFPVTNPPGAIMGVTERSGNVDALFITVRTAADALVDRGFQVIVVC